VAKILCTRPNASDNINGYPFEPHPDGGMISVDNLPEKVVKAFVRIDGYQAVETDPPPSVRFEPGDPAALRTESAVPSETDPGAQPTETEPHAPEKSGRRTRKTDSE
jgi:hypothetical protein